MQQFNEFSTKMNTIFINSKNSETSDPHRLSLNHTDKMDLRRKSKDIIISLSCHEQVCLSGLRFERYFSHHRAT